MWAIEDMMMWDIEDTVMWGTEDMMMWAIEDMMMWGTGITVSHTTQAMAALTVVWEIRAVVAA